MLKSSMTFMIFMGAEKRSEKVSSIQVLLSVSACIVIFLTCIFLKELSIISLVRYFFVEAFPFKNMCQMENFVIAYPPKECSLNK